MSITGDILRAWVRPRAVMARLLAQPAQETRAFGFMMVACFLIFIAQWPRLTRRAQGFGTPDGQDPPEMAQLVAYEFLMWMVVWPLLFFALAALSRGIAGLFGGRGNAYGARLALFWSLLASVPAMLVFGLLQGVLGGALATQMAGAIWLIGFGVIWLTSLFEAERQI